MRMLIKYIGVDVAKLTLDVDLPSCPTVANTAEGIMSLLQGLPAGAHLVCEATGGYEANLVASAWAAGVPISVVAPQRVRHHARSQGRLAKTDRLDGRLLSDYAATHRPAPTRVPEPRRRRLRELLRARAQLIELQKLEVNWQEHPGSHRLLAAQAQARTRLLDKQLQALEEAIRAEAAEPALAEICSRLQQVQGVGEVTAWTVVAELPELGQLAPGQAGAMAGLAPHPRDSGRQRGKRYIQDGRAQLRRVLYMASIAASRHNPVLRIFYQRLRSKGKPAKLALIAVARRLIELLNYIIKHPNFCLAS